jgi:magnesium transporter
MQATYVDNVLTQLRTALERDDFAAAAAIIESLRAPDQADLFAELLDEEQVALLPELSPANSADILEEMDDQEAAELVAGLSAKALIAIVDEMQPDEAADLLGDIDPGQAQMVLAGLEDPEEVRPLLLHPDDSAGGLMTSEFLALRRRICVTERGMDSSLRGALTAFVRLSALRPGSKFPRAYFAARRSEGRTSYCPQYRR